jgi:hypothetical protein
MARRSRAAAESHEKRGGMRDFFESDGEKELKGKEEKGVSVPISYFSLLTVSLTVDPDEP